MPRLATLLLALLPLPLLAADHHHHGQPKDPRTAIAVNTEEAAHLRGEMRGFLNSVQQIVAGAADNDMKRVAEAAQAAGMAAAHDVPAGLRAKLPLAFKHMGHTIHTGFDDLARDAASLGDPNLAMKQLGQVMTTCTGCHATYRLEVRATTKR